MPVCFQTPGHRRILSALQVKPPTRTPASGKRTNTRRDLQRSEAPSRGGEEETDGYQCLDHRRPQGCPAGAEDGIGPGPGTRGGGRSRERGGGGTPGPEASASRAPNLHGKIVFIREGEYNGKLTVLTAAANGAHVRQLLGTQQGWVASGATGYLLSPYSDI